MNNKKERLKRLSSGQRNKQLGEAEKTKGISKPRNETTKRKGKQINKKRVTQK